MTFLQVIGTILTSLITLYLMILTVRIILSWLVLPPARWTYYLNLITDPVLNWAKKWFPVRVGIIDLSVFFPFIILSLLSSLISDLMIMGVPFTPFYVIKLILIAVSMIVNAILFILVIFCIILIVLNFVKYYSYNPMLTAIKSIIDPFTMFIRRIIRINSRNADRIYLFITLALIILIWIIVYWILGLLLFQVAAWNAAFLRG
jgi:uncharacterized protein YggT (Ycf19 family)